MQSWRFLLLYALAVAGGAAAYVPFLTILLPLKVTGMAGDDGVRLLAYVAFAGAIFASGSNVLFGWLSDITKNRRGWILAGLASSSGLLILSGEARDTTTLIALICAWQIGLNMMLAPLAAWAGDCVPDGQKGLLGGLLSFSPAAGAMAGALVTIPGLAGPDARLELVALIVACLVLPVVVFGNARPMPHLVRPASPVPDQDTPYLQNRSATVRMWMARLLVQIAEAALFAYLLFWFRSIDGDFRDNDTAILFGAVLLAGVPLALWLGRWSDRHERPILPLTLGAAGIACGLLIMAAAPDLGMAVAGYVVFGLASSVFLALHSSQTLRVLPKPQNRGRDLGLFNLTNTTPSLVMPWLALALVPVFGFGALFVCLAVLSAVAALILMTLVPRK
ncbi:MAG: MFS transporter [Erythrobacter sp.]